MERLPRHRLLLIIAYIGFISLGLPDTLVGVAWPSVRDTLHLQQSAIALIFFGAGGSYFLSSFCAGRLLDTIGIGALLAASSLLVAGSGFVYGLAPVWAIFAAGSLLHGLGSGAIDAGLNYYAAHHFSVRHMNWLHACWGLGATAGPLMMTTAIAYGNWRLGYLTVALMLLALALLFAATRREWDEPESTKRTPEEKSGAGGFGDALRHPMVWLQVGIFFFYTGLEMTVGQWAFTLLTEARQVTPSMAGMWVTLYWGSIGIGRILFGSIAARLGVDRLLRLSTLAGLAGTGLLAANPPGPLSATALVLAGLGFASIYPCLMARTPTRLGKGLAAHAIGFQVSAATLGAAVLPSLAGLLAERSGLAVLPLLAMGMAATVLFLHESLLQFGQSRSV